MLTRLKLGSIPTLSGVYIFRRRKIPLYIGKAANLKQRLASYFQKSSKLPIKIQKMLAEATRLETIKTASEVEALIKEAELIKKYHPKYNILMRDDKNYFYVGITKEEFPRIFITHQPHQEATGSRGRVAGARADKTLSPITYHLSPRYVGPFTSGTTLKATLKLLRRVFPYCACKQPHKRPCLNSQIGRCPGYCCTIAKKKETRKEKREHAEYKKNIRSIIAVLEGKRTRLLVHLKRQMKETVKREQFEQAARLRDQIFGLEDIFAHQPLLREPEVRYSWMTIEPALRALLKTGRSIERIEGYDISNIGGSEATGSMVVFIRGVPDKNQYRKFRIKTVTGINDVDMLKEVLRRRFGHPEWPNAELMVIDGGKPQLGAALSALRESRIWNLESRRPIVTALAKREEILYTEGGRAIPLKRQDPTNLHLFQRIRDESHRFARAYHHKLREKAFTQ